MQTMLHLSEQADEPTSPRAPLDVNSIRAAGWRVPPGPVQPAGVCLAGGYCQQQGSSTVPAACVCVCVCVLVHLLLHVCVRVVGSRVREACFSAGHQTSLPAR